MRGRSPGLYAANFPDLSRSAVLLAADMLDPIAQKPNRGCTDRLGRPLCEVIQAVAFCRTSVMMSSEERGAVVAWHRRKLPFWPNASLFGHRDFVPPTQEGKSPRCARALRCAVTIFDSSPYPSLVYLSLFRSDCRFRMLVKRRSSFFS